MDENAGRLSRRGFLAGTIAAALAACSDGDDGAAPTSSPAPAGSADTPTTAPPSTSAPTTTAAATTTTVPVVTSDPFTLGVASGDPLPDAVVLWTRLLPRDPLPDIDVDVEWEVATDAELTDIVAAGSAVAVAALGHSMHIDVTGLEPDTEYHYRFRLGEFATPSARTRTFAAPGTTPGRFRFAFSSCQNWEHGYYAVYRDVVEQGDLDAFVFLGDYIYEHATGGFADSRARTTGQLFECETVEQYRERYALYRSDPLLQAATRWCRGSSRGTTTRWTTTTQQRAASRTTHATRSSPVAPPVTRSGTSTCRCVSTRRAGPTSTSTARSRTAT